VGEVKSGNPNWEAPRRPRLRGGGYVLRQGEKKIWGQLSTGEKGGKHRKNRGRAPGDNSNVETSIKSQDQTNDDMSLGRGGERLKREK